MHSSRNESERNESERNGSQRSGSDVLVVGGGIIGLVTAWRAAQRGLRTALADPDPGGGAARVAAGMLAAVTELHYGEETLLGLNVASAARYPRFAAELAEASGGMDIGYRACGTLAVALDADDRLHLRELHALQRRCGLESQWLTGRECRRLEPMLAPGVRGGLRVDGDHQVDPRYRGGAAGRLRTGRGRRAPGAGRPAADHRRPGGGRRTGGRYGAARRPGGPRGRPQRAAGGGAAGGGRTRTARQGAGAAAVGAARVRAVPVPDRTGRRARQPRLPGAPRERRARRRSHQRGTRLGHHGDGGRGVRAAPRRPRAGARHHRTPARRDAGQACAPAPPTTPRCWARPTCPGCTWPPGTTATGCC